MSETRTPWWATPAGCALILVVLMLPRMLFAARFGLIADEAYYAVWSFYPGFDYYDHSPAVAWFIWAGRGIFGESPFAVRSLFLVANLVTYAGMYRIGDIVSGDRRVGATAAIAYAVIPAVLLTFSVATPDGPSTMFWVLALWAIAEFIRSRNANWWLLVGILAGFGLLSKYTVAFLGVGILFYLVTSRERLAWLKHWQVWAGAVLAVLLFAPVLWNASRHHWDTFRFQLSRSTLEHPAFAGLGELGRFLLEESLQLLPTLAVFVAIGLVLFFARRVRSLALPVLTSLPMAAYFLIHAIFGRVNPNWTAPMFPELALIGAWAAVTVRPTQVWLRWPLDVLYVLHVPLGLSLLLVGFIALEDRALPFVGPLPVFEYVYGWDDLERKISAEARDSGAKWVDIADYGLNGMIAYSAKMADDPLPVYNVVQNYRYRFRPPLTKATRAEPHLIVRAATREGAPEGSRALGTITRDYQGKPLADYQVFITP